MNEIVPLSRVARRIYLLRGQRVMLSTDLAELYEVEPRALIQAVKRNLDRFPDDFMFQLNAEEVARLRSQIVILKPGAHPGRGQHQKYPPHVFTEQGVAMLSSVLHSKRAAHVNIAIMRAFVRLREMLASNHELARKFAAFEKRYDAQFRVVFEAIRQLMEPPETPRRRIGFGGRDEP
ncbi:MAG: ORF6N domain-containing protein [Myxococcales bacterium]|nr:ORF6N domain-containing protein [Myxococcales bacterium]